MIQRNTIIVAGVLLRKVKVLLNATLVYHGDTSPMIQHLKWKYLVKSPIKPADKQANDTRYFLKNRA